MHALDIGVVIAYVIGCMWLGAWFGSTARGAKGYLAADRDIPTWAVMISIVATETSAVTFLSVPGSSYRGDMTFLQLAIGYIVARFVVAFVLLPLYFRGQISTAYEVLAHRFGGATQKVSSLIFLISRTLGSGLRLFLAAKVLVVISGFSLPASIILIGISTILYTFMGGLKGVIWADVLQFFVYLIGALAAVLILARSLPGGWSTIVRMGHEAGKFRVFDFRTDLTVPYTFWAGLIGAMVLDMGTHGADHMMVQRYLSARSESQAAWALILSGFVIFAQFALFLVIGVGIWALDRSNPSAIVPQKDQEFATFIVHSMPTGLLGLLVAAIFSVTMSTVSGAISASASSTVNDLYKPLFPATTDSQLLTLSKGLTAFWGFAQIGVALGAIVLDRSVIDTALAIASFVMGILLGVFLLGILTRRVGQTSAFVGMVAGLATVLWCAFGTRLAYPWFALVGSTTVVVVGILTSTLERGFLRERLNRQADTS